MSEYKPTNKEMIVFLASYYEKYGDTHNAHKSKEYRKFIKELKKGK